MVLSFQLAVPIGQNKDFVSGGFTAAANWRGRGDPRGRASGLPEAVPEQPPQGGAEGAPEGVQASEGGAAVRSMLCSGLRSDRSAGAASDHAAGFFDFPGCAKREKRC